MLNFRYYAKFQILGFSHTLVLDGTVCNALKRRTQIPEFHKITITSNTLYYIISTHHIQDIHLLA